MKKLLPLFLLPFSLWAQKSTVVGNLQTTSGLPSASYVEFSLSNCGNNQPKVQGVTVLLPVATDFYADATGAITAAANGGVAPSLYGNDVIVCGSGSNTLYGMQVYVNGQPVGPQKFYNVISTASFNINTAMPVQQNSTPPPINPPQNGQFLNLNVINNLSAGNTTTGNLTVTGEVLGNLTVQNAITALTGQFTSALNAAILNGVVNPTFFPGGDLGAQINEAFLSDCVAGPNVTPLCVVQVPPGTYTVTTPIVMPGNTGGRQNIALLMDGANLNFSGTAIVYGIFTGIGSDHVFLRGGNLNFSAAPNAQGGIVMGYAAQGCYINDLRESGVTNGDGLLNLGCNRGTVTNSTFKNNTFGVHLLGSPGYSSNNITLMGNIIAGNSREGVVDGDISQYPVGWPLGNGGTWSTSGTSTANFNNQILYNDLEGNGSSSNRASENTVYPAVLIALTVGEVVAGNYFENTPFEQVKMGCLNFTDPLYVTLYNKSGPNCGTAQGPTINANYTTMDGGWDYFVNYANGATIVDNTEQADITNTCFVNGNIGGGTTVNNNTSLSTNYFCIGGAAQSPDGWSVNFGPNVTATDLATNGSQAFFNIGQTGTTEGVQVLKFILGGPNTPSNPNNSSGSNTKCDPAWARGSIIVDTCTSGATGCVTGGGVAWICKDDTVLATPIADGHATWVKAF